MLPQKWARPACTAGQPCHIGSSTVVQVSCVQIMDLQQTYNKTQVGWNEDPCYVQCGSRA